MVWARRRLWGPISGPVWKVTVVTYEGPLHCEFTLHQKVAKLSSNDTNGSTYVLIGYERFRKNST